MKLFFGEFRPNYSKYHFPYQVWLLREENDTVEKIYDNGFLPMRNKKDVYYLSRSVRVDLSKFELTSENRRILHKTGNFESDLLPLSEFDYSPIVQKMCKDYSEAKFGKGIFSSQGIKNIFTNTIYNYIFVFKEIETQENVGFAVCFAGNELIQYAHAFYAKQYMKENLGARMMLEAVNWAKKSNKRFIYLGTCYEQNALYKTEFKGVEFFNGFRWSDDLVELKELVGRESADVPLGGTMADKQEYLLKRKEFLQKYYDGDIGSLMSKYGVRVNF